MRKDKDALTIVAEAWSKMKEDGTASYREGKPNLSELARRTGISRKVLSRLIGNGLVEKPHGNCMATRRRAVNGTAAERCRQLLMSGVTNSSVLFREAVKAGYKGSLSSIKRFARENEALVPSKRHLAADNSRRIRRYETGKGECFQMDWGFVRVDVENGSTAQCACFAMVCHHCGMRYAEFFPNAKQENLFIGMIHAFAYMGMPETVLTDNMASVVRGRDGDGKPIFNGTYDDFQRTLGFRTKLCRPYHPWTKGSVERLVRYVKGNFIAGRTFLNVTDLNERALSWCNQENSRIHAGTGMIPTKAHSGEPLRMLPEASTLMAWLAPLRKITVDGFICYEGRRYGVPYSYVGKSARVMRAKDRLMIMDMGFSVIETHDVDWSKRPHYSAEQFEPELPEEHPTSPVMDIVAFRAPDSGGLERFDF